LDKNDRKRAAHVATDYDEAREACFDLKEAQDSSLAALQSASAPDALSVSRELDAADIMDDDILFPGWELVAGELIVQIVAQAEDEFTCYSCFLVRHRSQIFRETSGHAYCFECEA
jgi:hypothetical protein